MLSVSIAYLDYQTKTKNKMYCLLTTKEKFYLSPEKNVQYTLSDIYLQQRKVTYA